MSNVHIMMLIFFNIPLRDREKEWEGEREVGRERLRENEGWAEERFSFFF